MSKKAAGAWAAGAWGVRGERLKKIEEFFYPLSLKDFVFKTERQFPPPPGA
jgi:hypothetical protein